MKVKTSELTGQALDWAVAQAIGETHQTILENIIAGGDFFRPSTDWSQCGPLIAGFTVDFNVDYNALHKVSIFSARRDDGQVTGWQSGLTPQIAICRAVVASVLGDEIELPAELFRQEPEKP